MFNLEHVIVDNNKRQIINSENQHNVRYNIPDWIIIKYNTYCNNMLCLRDCPKTFKSITLHYKCNHLFLFSNYIILIFQIRISYSQIAYLRPGATKGTLHRENKNSFFDVLCLITFHWSFKNKLAF